MVIVDGCIALIIFATFLGGQNAISELGIPKTGWLTYASMTTKDYVELLLLRNRSGWIGWSYICMLRINYFSLIEKCLFSNRVYLCKLAWVCMFNTYNISMHVPNFKISQVGQDIDLCSNHYLDLTKPVNKIRRYKTDVKM